MHIYTVYKYTHRDMQLRERCTIAIIELKGLEFMAF